VLSAFDEPDLVWQCVAHGAAGYVDKQVGHLEICEAIRVAGAGRGFAERRPS
jgi:DNA-binding NarL/FixJ family response regulator